MQLTCRLLRLPVALLFAALLSGAGTLTTMYFPPSDSGSPLDVLMRGQFAAILAETSEPILHEPRGNTYAVRVTVYTVRGAVSFLRIERKSDGVVLSTFRRYGFSDLGVPLQRSIVQKNLPGTALTQLSAEIQRQNFFSLGSTGTVATVDVPVCLIEVYDGRAYHSAFRSACPRDTPFGAVAAKAAEIAGVDYFAD